MLTLQKYNNGDGSSRNDFEVLEAVKAGTWEWPEGVSVSRMAKAFVTGLLVVDPDERLTCEQALHHDWIQVDNAPSGGGRMYARGVSQSFRPSR